MIHYRCSQCRTVLRADDSERGQEQKCPKCGAMNAIPGGPRGAAKKRKRKKPAEEEKGSGNLALRVVLWGGLAAAVFATIFLYFHYRNRMPPEQEATMVFVPRLQEYADTSGMKEVPGDHPHAPYVVGEVAMVNRVAPETFEAFERDPKAESPTASQSPDGRYVGINWVEFSKLPEEYRAANPEEVECVICLDWSHVEIPNPRKGGVPGRQLICEVVLVDWNRSLITGRKKIRGGRPVPPQVSGGLSFGSRPTDEIIEYITGCKRMYNDITGQLTDYKPE